MADRLRDLLDMIKQLVELQKRQEVRDETATQEQKKNSQQDAGGVSASRLYRALRQRGRRFYGGDRRRSAFRPLSRSFHRRLHRPFKPEQPRPSYTFSPSPKPPSPSYPPWTAKPIPPTPLPNLNAPKIASEENLQKIGRPSRYRATENLLGAGGKFFPALGEIANLMRNLRQLGEAFGEFGKAWSGSMPKTPLGLPGLQKGITAATRGVGGVFGKIRGLVKPVRSKASAAMRSLASRGRGLAASAASAAKTGGRLVRQSYLAEKQALARRLPEAKRVVREQASRLAGAARRGVGQIPVVMRQFKLPKVRVPRPVMSAQQIPHAIPIQQQEAPSPAKPPRKPPKTVPPYFSGDLLYQTPPAAVQATARRAIEAGLSPSEVYKARAKADEYYPKHTRNRHALYQNALLEATNKGLPEENAKKYAADAVEKALSGRARPTQLGKSDNPLGGSENTFREMAESLRSIRQLLEDERNEGRQRDTGQLPPAEERVSAHGQMMPPLAVGGHGSDASATSSIRSHLKNASKAIGAIRGAWHLFQTLGK